MRTINRKKNYLKKLLAIGSELILCAGAIVATSLAWFVVNRTANSDCGEISVTENDIELSYAIYGWDDDLKAGEIKDNLILPEYDCFITTKNIYTNLILKVDVEYKTIVEETPLLLFINCSSDLLDSTSGEVLPQISNIAQFKIGNGSDNTYAINTTSAASIYETASLYFDNVLTSNDDIHKFVSISESSEVSKNKELSISNLILSPEATSQTVFLELDYNYDLIQYFFSLNEAGADSLSILTGGLSIDFISDITKFQFALGGDSNE